MNNTRKGFVPRETIDEIRSRSDIIEIISECGIALRPSGVVIIKHCVRFTMRKHPPLLSRCKNRFSTVLGVKQGVMLSLLCKSMKVRTSGRPWSG